MIEDYLMFIFLNNPYTFFKLPQRKQVNYQPKAEQFGVAVDLYSEAAVPTDVLILIKSD
jgi:hypothetical protein